MDEMKSDTGNTSKNGKDLAPGAHKLDPHLPPKRLGYPCLVAYNLSQRYNFLVLFLMEFNDGNLYLRLLTGVPIGGNKSTAGGNNNVESKKQGMAASTNHLPQKSTSQVIKPKSNTPSRWLALGKQITNQPPDEAPFMKSVMPVGNSLFTSLKSGVQTGVTAAVKAGKI